MRKEKLCRSAGNMSIRVVPLLRSRERLHAISFALVVITTLCSALSCPVLAQTWGTPVWSDEFNATVQGAPPDSNKWTFDTGGKGWGNNELEIYCAPGSSKPAPCDTNNPNAFQDGKGNLVIQAFRTSAAPPPAGTWTSARLKTRGLADFQYGRIEACMRLPVAAGLWPAFWMLGTTGKWPVGGEIDVMENVPATGGVGGGLGPNIIESTISGPSSSAPQNIYSLAKDLIFPGGGRVDDKKLSCHVYGIIWSPFMVQWYVDDWRSPFFIRTASDVPAGGRWVANNPNHYYLLLNLAVGGDWPGPPDASTPSPAPLLVDYVRVYRADKVTGPRMTASPISVKAGTSSSATLNLVSNTGTGRVYLSCSGAPRKATCSIDTGDALNPTVADFSSNGAQTARINVTTTANSALLPFFANPKLNPWNTIADSALLLALLVVLFLLRNRAVPRSIDGIYFAGLILAAVLLAGCVRRTSGASPPGGGNTGGTPSGNYTLTVTAYTVSGDTSTVNIPLTVN
jgi:beta-glucanase (GH16 family)